MSKLTELQNNKISRAERIFNLIHARSGLRKISYVLEAICNACERNGGWINTNDFLEREWRNCETYSTLECVAYELQNLKDQGYIVTRYVPHKGLAKYFKRSHEEITVNRPFLEDALITNSECEAQEIAGFYFEDIAMLRQCSYSTEWDELQYRKELGGLITEARGLRR